MKVANCGTPIADCTVIGSRAGLFHRALRRTSVEISEQIDDMAGLLPEGISLSMDDPRREGMWRG